MPLSITDNQNFRTALEPMRKRNSMKGQHDALEYPPALIIAAPLPLTKYEAGGLSGTLHHPVRSSTHSTLPSQLLITSSACPA